MRILIDLQAYQGSNGQRGIGRLIISLTKSLLKHSTNHEFFIFLSSLFPEKLEEIIVELANYLPKENIIVGDMLGPVMACNEKNIDRIRASELIRESFLEQCAPDIILLPSLFEGYVDNVITSIKKPLDTPVVVILYDLIPLIYKNVYLKNKTVEKWYLNKLKDLGAADLLLAISTSTAADAAKYLSIPEKKITTIYAGADNFFSTKVIDQAVINQINKKYSIRRPYIMYTGGIDFRKNIESLIAAYAKLLPCIRDTYQLLIVCSIQPLDKENLNQHISSLGLNNEAVIFTGFVSDDELLTLYNCCKLFIFPSLYEGFGLPVLEAMQCGKAVLTSNTSSMPELVGVEEALFDPEDIDSITSKLNQALTDEEFIKKLENNSCMQAKKFSWDKSAQITLTALEKIFTERPSIDDKKIPNNRKKSLAYVSPLPTMQTGIADYSAQLLPFLIEYYDIEVVTEQKSITDKWINNHCEIQSIENFSKNYKHYDRILYHFGNSDFHQYMFDLLDKTGGVVVLHDFFLSGVLQYMEFTKYSTLCWSKSLYYSHGYIALFERYHCKPSSLAKIVYKYPCNLETIQNAYGIISHSHFSQFLAEQHYGPSSGLTNCFTQIPLLKIPENNKALLDIRKNLDIPLDAFLICSFGMLGRTKLNHLLLEAFLSSELAKDANTYLIFVGKNDETEYGQELLANINNSIYKDRIKITGWNNHEVYNNYLKCADIAVQLRTSSRGETSAAILDCLNHEVATIVNSHGSIKEIPDDIVCMIADQFEINELINALDILHSNKQLRFKLAKKGKEYIKENHSPKKCAKLYRDSIEKYYVSSRSTLDKLVDRLFYENKLKISNHGTRLIVENLAKNFPPVPRQKQLFLDISELVQHDASSGIQRVVKSILENLVKTPPIGWRIEPVYATMDKPGYYYAHEFMANFLQLPDNIFLDRPIDAYADDIFLGLDLQPQIIPAQQQFLTELHRRNVAIYFVIYDLITINHPEFFVTGAKELFSSWLQTITQYNAAICISESVKTDLQAWCAKENVNNFTAQYFHLGADLHHPITSQENSTNSKPLLSNITKGKNFLMVGTVEPRKGHLQTLLAFEILWQKNHDINLIIVGKRGWLMEDLIEKITHHPELNQHLFWFPEADDELLEKIYTRSICLIAASEAEGFGLPLVEAAQHKIPIIARDIAVFREVAAQYAYYFIGKTAEDLADTIINWLELYKNNRHPKSNNMPWLTWEESANQLLRLIIPDYKNL